MKYDQKNKNWKMGCSILLIFSLVTTVLFYYLIKNFNHYTLQPGESIELKVQTDKKQLEPRSELIIKKTNNTKIKLSGRKGWGMKDSDIVYNVEEQSITELNFSASGGDYKILPNDKNKSIYLEKDGIILQGKLSRSFGVSDKDSVTITITNVDDRLARFEAQVVNR